MPTPERSPVGLEAASHLLDRAARSQFAAFLDALRVEYDASVVVLLSAATTEEVFAAQGASNAFRRLIERMEGAEATLAKHHSKKERAR